MSLASISIRRPVLATVMSTVLVIFGIVGYSFLGVREFPAVDPAIISVGTSYPGANAQVIESQITTPLEEAVNSVPGIRNLTSVSRDGRSSLTVEFLVGIDLETAANDVRDKVAGAIGRLPPDVEPSQVSKADADSFPIVFLGVRSSLRDLLELTAYADKVFKTRLETIPGVSNVDIWGSKDYSMRLWIDPARLAAYGLTPLDIRTALQGSNVELPSGRIEGNLVELTVRTLSRLSTPEQFNDLILKHNGDALVRLRDIGRAAGGDRPRHHAQKRRSRRRRHAWRGNADRRPDRRRTRLRGCRDPAGDPFEVGNDRRRNGHRFPDVPHRRAVRPPGAPLLPSPFGCGRRW